MFFFLLFLWRSRDEKEAYAIVYALEKLNYYLSGATFVIKTEHKPLQYLFEADWTNKKI